MLGLFLIDVLALCHLKLQDLVWLKQAQQAVVTFLLS